MWATSKTHIKRITNIKSHETANVILFSCKTQSLTTQEQALTVKKLSTWCCLSLNLVLEDDIEIYSRPWRFSNPLQTWVRTPIIGRSVAWTFDKCEARHVNKITNMSIIWNQICMFPYDQKYVDGPRHASLNNIMGKVERMAYIQYIPHSETSLKNCIFRQEIRQISNTKYNDKYLHSSDYIWPLLLRFAFM